MNKVPITRFQREIRKWMRKGEIVHLTRNGVVVGVLVPAGTYELITKRFL